MAIEGLIHDLHLIDLFQLLALAQKTGVLVVTGPAEEAKILFQKGTVAFAGDRKAGEQYGEILGKTRVALTERNAGTWEDVQQAWALLEERGEVQALSSLKRALVAATEETAYRLFNWKEGRFRFEEAAEPPGSESLLTLGLKTENLIMEGTRRIDEWSRIQTRIPSLDAVVSLTPDEGEKRGIDLRPEEWAILAQVDGRKRVREIIGLLGGKDFEVARTLYGLAATGLVKVVAEGPKTIPMENAREADEYLVEGARWLAQGNLDRAWEEALEALRLAPDSGPAHLLLGHVSYHRGLAERALAEYEAACARGVVEGYYRMGLCYSRRGNFAQATKVIGEFLTHSPNGEISVRARRALNLLAELEDLLKSA
jgi:tetratricopeptide (TPR) repeat protein